jgi:hypothetical protein
MAEAVESGYVPVTLPAAAGTNSEYSGVDERIKVYDVERMPVFCGRDEFFAAYHELFHPAKGKQYSVVAAYSETVEKGLGHSRLLLELTAQGIRDHHIPCLVGSDDPNWNPPKNRTQLVIAFYKAIAKAREAFGLSAPLSSQLDVLRRTLPKKLGASRELDRDVKERLGEPGDELSVDAVRMALKKDLDVLRGNISVRCPDALTAGGHVLFLLDKVDQYAEALNDLLSGLLGPYGLTAAGPLVPVIMVFTNSGSDLQKFVKEVAPTRTWLKLMKLEPLKRNGEDFLAFERVLLHPFRERPPIATKAWVINWSKEALADIEGLLKDHLQGIPCNFGGDMVYAYAQAATRSNVILSADDTDILNQIQKRMPYL